MSDFDRLSDSQKSLLMTKLDGYAEAAVQAARIRNIGLSQRAAETIDRPRRHHVHFTACQGLEQWIECWTAATLMGSVCPSVLVILLLSPFDNDIGGRWKRHCRKP